MADPQYSELICKWSCPQCTLDNATSTDYCVACGTVRYSVGANPPAEGVVEFQPKPGSSVMTLLTRRGPGGGLRWACPRCTWQNYADSAYCETCKFRATNVVEELENNDPPNEVPHDRPQPKAADNSSSVSQSIGNFLKKTFSTSETDQHPPRHPRHTPLTTAATTTSAPSTSAPVDGWSCPHCTFMNHRDLMYCEQCRSTPDQLPPSDSSEPQDYMSPISLINPQPSTGSPKGRTSDTGIKKTPPPRPNYQPNQPRPHPQAPGGKKIPPKKPPRSPNKPSKPVRPPSPKIRVTATNSITDIDTSPKNARQRPPPLKQAKASSYDVHSISPVLVPKSQSSPKSPLSPKSPSRNMYSPKVTPRTKNGSPLPPPPEFSPPISPRPVPRPRTSPKPRSNTSPQRESPPIKPKPAVKPTTSPNTKQVTSSFPDSKPSINYNRKQQDINTCTEIDRRLPSSSPPVLKRSSSVTVEELKQHEESRALALWYNIVDEHRGVSVYV